MIPSRYALLGVCALSLFLARRRPVLRPAAVALTTLAAIDFSRRLGLPARLDTPFLWCMWPSVPAALAWRVWKNARPAVANEPRTPSTHGGRAAPILARLREPWARVALAFAFYATTIALAPWSWAAHPWAWSVARTLPYVVAPLVGVAAWATQKKGPRDVSRSPAAPALRSRPGQSADLYREFCPATVDAPTKPNALNPAAQASRRVAALLTVSALIDVIVLLPSLDAASWGLAAPLAWATWIACGAVIVMGARRPRVIE